MEYLKKKGSRYGGNDKYENPEIYEIPREIKYLTVEDAIGLIKEWSFEIDNVLKLRENFEKGQKLHSEDGKKSLDIDNVQKEVGDDRGKNIQEIKDLYYEIYYGVDDRRVKKKGLSPYKVVSLDGKKVLLSEYIGKIVDSGIESENKDIAMEFKKKFELLGDIAEKYIEKEDIGRDPREKVSCEVDKVTKKGLKKAEKHKVKLNEEAGYSKSGRNAKVEQANEKLSAIDQVINIGKKLRFADEPSVASSNTCEIQQLQKAEYGGVKSRGILKK